MSSVVYPASHPTGGQTEEQGGNVVATLVTVASLFVTIGAMALQRRGLRVASGPPPITENRKVRDWPSHPLPMVNKEDSNCPERVACKRRDPHGKCPPVDWTQCPLRTNKHEDVK